MDSNILLKIENEMKLDSPKELNVQNNRTVIPLEGLFNSNQQKKSYVSDNLSNIDIASLDLNDTKNDNLFTLPPLSKC